MMKNMIVGYMLDYFPVLSETFIVREILELRRRHLHVEVFARVNTANHVCSEIIHNDTKKLMENVHYFPLLSAFSEKKPWLRIIGLHSYFFIKNPFRYMKTLWFALNYGRTVFVRFVLSVFYAHELIKSKVDHMHVHFAFESCAYAMLISMYTEIPFSFTVHAHDIFIPQLPDMIEVKFNNANFAVCISEYNKQYVLKRYPSVKPEKIRIIHCGLNMSVFTPETKMIDKQFTVLSVGRLVEHKGFGYLIEACRILKENADIDFICNIIGEGIERLKYEQLISELDLIGVVHLLGAREQSEVMRALKCADLFVLPCVTEERGMQDGIPVSLMEAMAMEIPVISTRVSGIPELIKDGSGILVEPRDAKALAMAIGKILKLPAEEKERMVGKGRVIIENEFNVEKEVEKLGELFILR
jgi:colanic acid/amylovoran biosynthesis glycosyltransferase